MVADHAERGRQPRCPRKYTTKQIAIIPRMHANPATKIWVKGLRTSVTTVYTARPAMKNWPKKLALSQPSCCLQVAYAAQTPTTEIASNVTEPIVDVRVAASAKSRTVK